MKKKSKEARELDDSSRPIELFCWINFGHFYEEIEIKSLTEVESKKVDQNENFIK